MTEANDNVSFEPFGKPAARLGEVFMKLRNAWLLAGAMSATIALSTTASHATGLLQPGQFMGVSTGSQLPVGVFASELSDYGKSDNSRSGLEVNIPIVTWATPFKLLDSQVLFSYSAPFVYQNGLQYSNPLAQSRLDYRSQALGATLAHSFGNGFSAGLSGFVRTPDNYFTNYTATDIFLGLDYVSSAFEIHTTFTYSGTFGSHRGSPAPLAPLQALTGITGSSDAVGVDFTLEKRFDKLSLGFVGFGHTDINTRLDNTGFNVNGFRVVGGIPEPTFATYDKRQGSIGVGGLVGYDFGRFTVQGMVTREVAKRFAYNGFDASGLNIGYGQRETRGWVRLIVPLYVAPHTPAPVVARY